jgi:hypothetical protein
MIFLGVTTNLTLSSKKKKNLKYCINFKFFLCMVSFRIGAAARALGAEALCK